MNNLFILLSECTKSRDVDRIVEENIAGLNESDSKAFCRMANLAKRRINRIRREAKISYMNLLN